MTQIPMNPTYSEEQLVALKNLSTAIRNSQGYGGLPSEVKLIDAKKGSFEGCVRNLIALHKLKADKAWFGDRDLREFRLQAYIASKLHYIHCVEVEPRNLTQEWVYFYGLFSNHEPLIRWMMGLEPSTPHGINIVSNPEDAYFRHWQMTLALRRDWKLVAERAKLFLLNVPPKQKKMAIDQRFYLALAQGHREGMLVTLNELVSPKLAKVRNNVFEMAFARSFIAYHASMYAKIAWRAGYEITVDSSLIPADWLPSDPLDDYRDPYEFMRKYTISH
jgi:hypothetical protein